MTCPEPTRELQEERDRMLKRLERLKMSTANTPKRRQNWALRSEIEVLEANLASLARRYRFD
jgi:hypothetical protein